MFWVLGRHWAIWYPKEPVCAVRGSTVVIPCTYFYPEGNQVKETMWCLNHENCIQTLYVCHSKNVSVSSGYKDRAECLGDKEKYCTLMIKNIRHTDTGVYKFRFITDKDKWYGKEGVTVLITGKVVMTSSCSLNQSEFIWFKDKEHLPETHFILHFHSVSLKHFGKYSCAIKGYEETVSTDYHLDVQSKNCFKI
uniref:Immunoglobulin domain-containing protein n=1 Tax=Scleropages formosus TaxID=113540 RepID=A0A8C9RBY7_SCLFO